MYEELSTLQGKVSADTIDQLNSFLRGELSAVATYQQAIDKFTDPDMVTQLRGCLASHYERTRLLSEAVRRLGGVPSESSGLWGAFAKLVEGGAKIFGERAAIAAL